MARRDELNTTSFAMLGMLGIRPWSTYELAKHMDRSLGRLWPRARSNLFKEPKKLVAHGLADAVEEMVGKRPRTVYSITAKGRRALRTWLGEPGEGPTLEFEQLLKVFFADQGSKADALAAVRCIQGWVAEQDRENTEVVRQYVQGEGPFPERMAILTVMGKFWTDYIDAIAGWADWAEAVIAEWPDDLSQAEPRWEVLTDYAERAGITPPASFPPAPPRPAGGGAAAERRSGGRGRVFADPPYLA
jgi:PadR family transcriptional regulator, regulatory protein AphA